MGFPNDSGGITTAEREKLAKLVVGLKTNLNATSAPTVSDDTKSGYSVESTWIYNNVTYKCTDATEGKAVWAPSTDMYYFNTWAELETELNASTVGKYTNKFATVANANSGPSPENGEFMTPGAVWKPIVDGGSAIYKILDDIEGSFTVICQPRNITNPVVKKIYLSPEPKPTVAGYYIFSVAPIDGLPEGMELNDIVLFDGSKWSIFQKYSNATAVLVASSVSSLSQVTWRKFAGSWMSTADEYIPDGLEYQTGKLWNGKPVFRKCIAGTSPTSCAETQTDYYIPITGTRLNVGGIIGRTDNKEMTIDSYSLQILIYKTTGRIYFLPMNALYCNCPYVVWVEYTKS